MLLTKDISILPVRPELGFAWRPLFTVNTHLDGQMELSRLELEFKISNVKIISKGKDGKSKGS